MTPYLLLAIPPLLLVFITLVARLERRMVWPYGELVPYPQFPGDSPYGPQRVAEAQAAGFSFHGWAPDIKGPRYQVSYALLISPERDCLVLVGAGKMQAITVECTWIYTRTADRRMYYSTDSDSGSEFDLARRWRGQWVPAVTFRELLVRHRVLIQDSGATVAPFTAGQEIAEFRRAREERFQEMADRKMIVFTDPSAGRWHYTLWAALRLSAQSLSISLLRNLTGGKLPRCI